MTDRELLEYLVAEVQALRASFDRLAPEPRLRRKDRLRLMRLLPAILGEFVDAEFLAAHVVTSTTLQPLCGTMSAQVLGKFFHRVQDVWVNGFRIQKVDEQRGTIRWRVEQSPVGRLGERTGYRAA